MSRDEKDWDGAKRRPCCGKSFHRGKTSVSHCTVQNSLELLGHKTRVGRGQLSD